MRGAALEASNMENYSLLSQSTHVPGNLGGPVVDSRRQLWSVAGYLDMVVRGVFGLEDDGRVAPELPVSLLPMLFGTGQPHTPLSRWAHDHTRPSDRCRRPAVGCRASPAPGRYDGSAARPRPGRSPAAPHELHPMYLAATSDSPRLTVSDADPAARVVGSWPRHWTATRRGSYLAWLDYSNRHGPINTGHNGGGQAPRGALRRQSARGAARSDAPQRGLAGLHVGSLPGRCRRSLHVLAAAGVQYE